MTILAAASHTHARDRILGVATRAAKAFGEDLHVVHLVEEGTPSARSAELREQLRDQVASEDVAATVTVEPVTAARGRKAPHLGQALLDLAGEEVTRIVVGHDSRSLLGEVTQGSTAFTVADAASVPVVIVPPRADGPEVWG
jgi:nucleotide-binding universal stress UspA family protein